MSLNDSNMSFSFSRADLEGYSEIYSFCCPGFTYDDDLSIATDYVTILDNFKIDFKLSLNPIPTLYINKDYLSIYFDCLVLRVIEVPHRFRSLN